MAKSKKQAADAETEVVAPTHQWCDLVLPEDGLRLNGQAIAGGTVIGSVQLTKRDRAVLQWAVHGRLKVVPQDG